MIHGIGTDIIEIDRIAKAISRHKRFLDRLFTASEQLASGQDLYKASYYAGRFAAKEAVVKALGTGFRGIDFKDIEILRDELGKPIVKLSARLANRFNNPTLLISISHSKHSAVAFCIWQ